MTRAENGTVGVAFERGDHASGSFCQRPRSLAANVHSGQFPSLQNRSAVPKDLFGRTRRDAGLGRRKAGKGDGRDRRRAPSAKRSPEHQLEIVQGTRSGDSKRRYQPVTCRSPRHEEGTDLADQVGRTVNTICQLRKGWPSEEPRFHLTRAESLDGCPLEVQGPHVSGLIQLRNGSGTNHVGSRKVRRAGRRLCEEEHQGIEGG